MACLGRSLLRPLLPRRPVLSSAAAHPRSPLSFLSSSSAPARGPRPSVASLSRTLGASSPLAPRFCPALAARFSSAPAEARQPDGQAPAAKLVELLEKEVEHETGVGSSEDETDICSFLDKSGWMLSTKEGHDEINMTKSHGNEKLTVFFTLSEINRQEDEFNDELDDEEDEMEGSQGDSPLSVNAVVNCEKPGHGVLTYDVNFEEGDVTVQNVAFYSSPDVAKMDSLEADWQRRGLYGGPVFSELDDELQEAFREYIAQRGVNDKLADFVLKYVTNGEQKEYLNWLKRVKDHAGA